LIPKVSIIIPLFDKQDYIEDTLRSVKLQSFKDFECIIVDDGSTDKSALKVKKFIEEHNLDWTLVTQENAGQAQARNCGATLSKGEFLAFLDGDDLWSLNKLETQVACIESNPECVMVLSGYLIFNEATRKIRVVKHKNVKRMNTRWAELLGFGGALESVGLIRKSVFNSIGMFDTNFSTSAGLDLSLRLQKHGAIRFVNKVGMYYRISNGQWHTDLSLLESEMSRIVEKHFLRQQQRMAKLHRSYFYWSKLRAEPKYVLLKYFFFSILLFKFSNLRMFFRLVCRNLIALAKGYST
jgi:glycosyltransferase involved in cell wall biosynthesis